MYVTFMPSPLAREPLSRCPSFRHELWLHIRAVVCFSAYNDKVIAFLRQANIIEILQERHSAFRSNMALRDKVTAIRNDGIDALERLCNDVDLIILLRWVHKSRAQPKIAVGQIPESQIQAIEDDFYCSALKFEYRRKYHCHFGI